MESVKRSKPSMVWQFGVFPLGVILLWPIRPIRKHPIKRNNRSSSLPGLIMHTDSNQRRSSLLMNWKRQKGASLSSVEGSYPIMAGSSSLSDYYDKKYDLVLTPMTWHDANNTAYGLNGRLAVIESEKENNFIHDQFKDAKVNGFDSSGNQVNLAWIGAKDSADQNGSSYDPETNASAIFEINASEVTGTGWMVDIDGRSLTLILNSMPCGLVASSHPMEIRILGQWTGALLKGWTDANETYRLPFIMNMIWRRANPKLG